MGAVRPVENDALIESSFRRLLAAVESEREKIRSMWQQIEQERENTTTELERLKQDTEEWCFRERQKIDSEWKKLEDLHETMSALYPESTEVVVVNCSGVIFKFSKAALCAVEGSYLNRMFSKAFIDQIPRDSEDRYLLDFNPKCFGLVVEYLQKCIDVHTRKLDPNVALPLVPVEQQANMDILAEALNLQIFLPENRIPPMHQTSLSVRGNTVEATHKGWQCIAAQRALILSKPSYFEVSIDGNPDPRGGLALGVMGHVPTGTEIHTIRLADSILYNSSNGLVGDAAGADDAVKGLQFSEGSKVGVKFDPAARSIHFFYNRQSVGSCTIRADKLDGMRTLYPVFALYMPGQRVSVDFKAPMPAGGTVALALSGS